MATHGNKCTYGLCKSDKRYKHKPYMKDIFISTISKSKASKQKWTTWLQACGRPDLLKNTSRRYQYVNICCKHFVGGNGPTVSHPDPVPYEAVVKLENNRRIVSELTALGRKNLKDKYELLLKMKQQRSKKNTSISHPDLNGDSSHSLESGIHDDLDDDSSDSLESEIDDHPEDEYEFEEEDEDDDEDDEDEENILSDKIGNNTVSEPITNLEVFVDSTFTFNREDSEINETVN